MVQIIYAPILKPVLPGIRTTTNINFQTVANKNCTVGSLLPSAEHQPMPTNGGGRIPHPHLAILTDGTSSRPLCQVVTISPSHLAILPHSTASPQLCQVVKD